jgi:acetoacetate decarboxylase
MKRIAWVVGLLVLGCAASKAVIVAAPQVDPKIMKEGFLLNCIHRFDGTPFSGDLVERVCTCTANELERREAWSGTKERLGSALDVAAHECTEQAWGDGAI